MDDSLADRAPIAPFEDGKAAGGDYRILVARLQALQIATPTAKASARASRLAPTGVAGLASGGSFNQQVARRLAGG